MAVAGGDCKPHRSSRLSFTYVATRQILAKLSRSICQCKAIVLSTWEDVHHSNEPHDPGNTNESRVDTEVQNYAMHHYSICCEVPNSPSPNHGQDPATIERVGGEERKFSPAGVKVSRPCRFRAGPR